MMERKPRTPLTDEEKALNRMIRKGTEIAEYWGYKVIPVFRHGKRKEGEKGEQFHLFIRKGKCFGVCFRNPGTTMDGDVLKKISNDYGISLYFVDNSPYFMELLQRAYNAGENTGEAPPVQNA